MRITFACLGAENLGVEYLSSVLRKEGHSTCLVFDPALFNDKYWLDIPSLARLFDRRKRVVDEIIESRPDLLAFSVVTDTYRWALSVAADVRMKANIPVVFGGIHPTSVPELVIREPAVDYVIVGEGEGAILDLAGGKRDVPNVWRKEGEKVIRHEVRPLAADLDSIPFPDKDLFAPYFSQKSYTLMTARDCPFDCTYCCNSVLHRLYGHPRRKRSIDNVLQELAWGRKRFLFNAVNFMDDNFTLDRKWLRDFLPNFTREFGVPFRCLTHPTIIDYDTAVLLKKHGCEAIDIGVQSLNPRIRQDLLNRHMSNERIAESLDAIRRAGLKTHVDHMVGFPGETEEDLVEAARFYTRHVPNRFTYYYLSYFPATDIIARAGLSPEKVESINQGREKMYLSGGSVESAVTRNFEAVFKLLPLLPPGAVRYILDRKIYRVFRYLPLFTLFLDLATMLKTREYRAFYYLGYYLRNMLPRRKTVTEKEVISNQ
jgi:radical SAM superfamily enzyme YgiQ (UPF0313 family)